MQLVFVRFVLDPNPEGVGLLLDPFASLSGMSCEWCRTPISRSRDKVVVPESMVHVCEAVMRFVRFDSDTYMWHKSRALGHLVIPTPP